MIRESCGLVDFATFSPKLDRFLSLPPVSLRRNPGVRSRLLLSAHRNRQGGCLPSRSPFAGRSQKLSCRDAAFRRCTKRRACVSTHAATKAGRRPTDGNLAGPDRGGHHVDGCITGVHRTWLDPFRRRGKAPIDTPRRAMGDLLGNAVRFGEADDVLPRARASRRCYRCAVDCRPCRWPLHSRPITSRPCCYRRVCAGSISPATPMLPEMRCKPLTQRAEAAGIEAITLSPRWVTSTRICTSSASMPSGQHCGFSSCPRTSTASCFGHCRISALAAIRRQFGRDSPMPARTRPRPSRGRSDGRRRGPAMAASGYFPPACHPQ